MVALAMNLSSLLGEWDSDGKNGWAVAVEPTTRLFVDVILIWLLLIAIGHHNQGSFVPNDGGIQLRCHRGLREE
jgi:hypothetical protein